VGDEGSITRLLRAAEAGDEDAERALFERVYDELRSMAAARLTREDPAPEDGGGTDLTHDAYTRLGAERFENRKHLFFAYARAMRRILIERARRANTEKHGGGRRRALMDLEGIDGGSGGALDALELDELIQKLRDVSSREADVVELRAFGGLSSAHIGDLLSISERTVRDDLAQARDRIAAWIKP